MQKSSSLRHTGSFNDNDVDSLLSDFEYVNVIYRGGDESTELLASIHYLYDAFSKSVEFIKWAAKNEINSAKDHSNVICRGETLFTKLLYILISDNLGKRFLSVTLVPMLQGLYNKYSEKKFTDSLEDVSCVLELIEKFLNVRNDLVHLCPLMIREAFCFLSNEIAIKYPQENIPSIMTSIIFFRFFGPCILFPVKYGLFEHSQFSRTDDLKSVLLYVSKIIQSVATGYEFDTAKPHSAKLNEFVIKHHQIVLDSTKELVDAVAVTRMRKIVEASKPVVFEEEKVHTIKSLKLCLANCGLTCARQIDLVKKVELTKLMEIHNSTDWIQKHLKNDICTSIKNMPEGIACVKIVAKINCTMDDAFKARHDLLLERMHPSIRFVGIVEKFDEEHDDIYIITHAPFPLISRDWLFTRWDSLNPSISICLNFSTSRADCPPFKKYVRGHYFSSGMIITAEEDNVVKVHQYIQTDLKGNIPKPILLLAYKDAEKGMLQLKKYLEGDKRVIKIFKMEDKENTKIKIQELQSKQSGK